MWKIYLKSRFQESKVQKSNYIKICSFLILIVLFSISLNAQTPQGIGKFKISKYTLDDLFSEYDFKELVDSNEDFERMFYIRRFGGSESYEILLSEDGIAYSNVLIENHRIFNICNYSVAGIVLKGLNLYFYEGVLYKISIQNRIIKLLDKLILKYPSIEKDEYETEKVYFQNALGLSIEKDNVSRSGNWKSENGITVSFYDNYYYDDDGDHQHIERIEISDEEINTFIGAIEKKIRKKAIEKIEEEQRKLDEEL